MASLILAALGAFAVSVALTAITRRVATFFGVVDRPDGVRKLHRAPVPLLGGVAVCGAWALGVAVASGLSVTSGDGVIGFGVNLYQFCFGTPLGPALILAVCVVVVMGIVDDVVVLRARTKLVGQAIAAGALVAGGLVVERLWLFGHTLTLTRPAGVAFTLVWIIGSMNALNMLDGMDGLASTVGLITSLSLACMAWLAQHPALSLMMTALSGALAGFLLFNLPPARIFLGDSGSTLVGLLVGATAIRGSFKAPATAALAAPVAVLTVPIFDGLAAVIRRRLTGTSVACPDRAHLHHCLQRRGWSNGRILATVGSLCALTGLAALASLFFRSEPVAVLATLTVICGCIATRLFGHFECVLLLWKSRALWAALSGCLRLKGSVVAVLCYRLGQCRSADEAWAALLGAAGPLNLQALELRLIAPSSPFRAEWRSAEQPHGRPVWYARITLAVRGRVLGQFGMGGGQHRQSALANLVAMDNVARTLAAVCSRFQENSTAVYPVLPAEADPGPLRRLVAGAQSEKAA
jgi:UDP-GlcNAc:undecaprenyl-phosphate GlcNAc-1-phosphate transferase